MAVYSIGSKSTAISPQTAELFAKTTNPLFQNRIDFMVALSWMREMSMKAAGQNSETPFDQKIERISLLVFSFDVRDERKLAAETPDPCKQFLGNRLRCAAFYEKGGDDYIFDGFTSKEYHRFEYENKLGIALSAKAYFNEKTGVFDEPVPATSFYSEKLAAAPAAKKFFLFFDPGHGGLDPGAVYKDSKGNVLYKEAENTRAIARIAMPILSESGLFEVHSTMEMYPAGDAPDNIRPPCGGRTLFAIRYAKEHGGVLAGIFSVHNDASDNKGAHGATALYGGSAYEDLAQYIIDGYVDGVKIENRHLFASRGISERSKNVGVLTVAYKYSIPNTLLECGFISNQGEADTLSNPVYQQLIATAYANTIINAHNDKKF